MFGKMCNAFEENPFGNSSKLEKVLMWNKKCLIMYDSVIKCNGCTIFFKIKAFILIVDVWLKRNSRSEKTFIL